MLPSSITVTKEACRSMPSLGFKKRLATFIIVLASSFLLLFFSIASFRFSHTAGSRRNLKILYCCHLHYYHNAGHLLTDNVLDLHRCRPAVSFANRPAVKASDYHLYRIAKILETRILPQKACIDFYTRQAHPYSTRMKAYSKWSTSDDYDAIEVRDRLREVQKKVLTYCNINIPSYKNNIDLGDDRYEQIRSPHRSPSKSVMIIRRERDDSRVLLNAQEILTTCQGLGLSCQIIEIGNFFHQPASENLCYVLEKFAHTVSIGMQGAGNIYPHFTSGRMFLMVPNPIELDPSEPLNTCRFGDNLIEDEEQVAKNLISRNKNTFDWFHLEFSAHFGNTLRPISGVVDMDSLEHVKQTATKMQCQVNPLYCADLNANITQIKAELQYLIEKGYLLTLEKQKWWIQQCQIHNLCLFGSRSRENSTKNMSN